MNINKYKSKTNHNSKTHSVNVRVPTEDWLIAKNHGINISMFIRDQFNKLAHALKNKKPETSV